MADQRKKKGQVILVIVTVLVIFYGTAVSYTTLAKDLGPWEGRVLDMDTGKPVEGAVILAIWEKETPNFIHMTSFSFHGAIEVITNNNGYFFIPRHNPINFSPGFSVIHGPKIHIYKPGYCYADEGGPVFVKDSKVETLKRTFSMKVSKTTYIRSPNQIELSKIPDLPLRDKWGYLPSPPDDVPIIKMINFMKAINQGSVSLSLEPYDIPKDKYLLSLTRNQLIYTKMAKVQQSSARQIKSAPADIKSGKIIHNGEGHGKGSSLK